VTEFVRLLQRMPVQLHGDESLGFQLERVLEGSERWSFAWRRKRPSWLRESVGEIREKKRKKSMMNNSSTIMLLVLVLFLCC